ncbi:MAG: fumarylacetoacetate hydrolase family protein [Planctomycetota bacterium]
MKIVTFTREPGGEPRLGALLADGDILDFTHDEVGIPQPANHNDWYDLDGSHLPQADAAHDAVTSDAGRLAGLRTAGAVVARGDVTLLAPVPRPGKVICIGLNYKDHAEESKMDLPERPLMFSKFPTSITGPGAPVVIPPLTEQVDYEAELAVIIGRRASRVSAADGYDHVLGYANFNDVSARDFQFADGQWQRGKSPDTFGPLGEYIATTDEVPDPHTLRISLRLNGETLQDSNTDQLIFRVPELIEKLSESVTLEPGDVIATGTPPGVGFARKPPIWVKAGDVMEVEIAGLGVLSNPVTE